ncbi:FG-GAP repeat domain-containing protein [Aliiroseovarius sp. PTFE2010]|uniref:FG-GAP repeat domain-containing protein n=1 Tax=Aliiroseovarius sp. PTFE2010 TaxID=3417190 RepID=UPI003CEF6E43
MRTLARALALAVALPGALAAQDRGCTQGDGIYLTRVCYGAQQRDRAYGHNVLGNTQEWTSLGLSATAIGQSALNLPGPVASIGIPVPLIFEDIAPRIVDVSGDGLPDIVTIVSSPGDGASLTVYDLANADLASTRPIGQTNRWLAPVGIADFDADGRIDIAYVEQPHLAKTLRVVSYTQTDSGPILSEVDNLTGLTNHRIGDAFIQGGVTNCGKGPVIYTADENWRSVMQTRLTRDGLQTRAVGPYVDRTSFAPYLACQR